jgi:hypothetical protein
VSKDPAYNEGTQFHTIQKAMVTEVNEHIKRICWKPILKSNLPENTVILLAIWALKRNRRIDIRGGSTSGKVGSTLEDTK